MDLVMSLEPAYPSVPDVPVVMAVVDDGIPHGPREPSRQARGKSGNTQHDGAEIPEAQNPARRDEPRYRQQHPGRLVMHAVGLSKQAAWSMVHPAMENVLEEPPQQISRRQRQRELACGGSPDLYVPDQKEHRTR